ncbi:MAG: hypothetical protein HY289_06685 [Planctomycetes bacterium]|nr:hypothetical protein [Planctomycetota bacterium]
MLLTCTRCNTTMRVPDGAAGQQVKCPTCAAVIDVPGIAPPDPTAITSPLPQPASSPPRSAPRGERDPFDPEPRSGRSDYHDADWDDDDDLDIRRGGPLRRSTSGLASTSLALGIVSLTLSTIGCLCCGLFGASFALIAGILAVVLGYLGKTPGNEGLASAGIICGAVGAACAILGIIAAIFWLSAIGFMG